MLLLQTVSLSLGLVGTEVLIYMVMCAFLALWLSVVVVGGWSRPRRWQLEGLSLAPFVAHRAQTLFLQVGYPHRRPVFQVQLEAYLVPLHNREGLRLRSTQTHDVLLPKQDFQIPWTPQRRGQYELRSVSLISVFPLQLMRWRRVKSVAQTVWVYPEITSPALSALATPGARSSLPVAHHFARTQAEHLAGTRPWRSGDSPRLIHWAGFARTGQLTVKEFQQVQQVSVGLVLGGGLSADTEDFEDALSLIAGFLKQFCAENGDHELAFVQMGNDLHQCADEVDYWQALTLAEISCEVDWDHWGEGWPQVSQVIYVGVRLPEQLAPLFQPLQSHGIGLSVYVPSALAQQHEGALTIPVRQHRGEGKS